MQLQNIFDQLSDGEFSQLSIGGQPAGVIDENNYTKVLNHINLGLTAIYTRFNLKERRLVIPLQPGVDTYDLAVSDILKVEKVTTDLDYEINLNLGEDIYSCFTPTMNSLRVPLVIVDQGVDLPDALKTDGLTIIYRANHPKVVASTWAVATGTATVELPDSHLTALLYLVASRVHNPIGMTNEFHAGNSYYAKYEGVCQELESRGIQVNHGSMNEKLTRGGWV